MPTAGSPRCWRTHSIALVIALLAALSEQVLFKHLHGTTGWIVLPLALVTSVYLGAAPGFTLLASGLALSWLPGLAGSDTGPSGAQLAGLAAEALMGAGLVLVLAHRMHKHRRALARAWITEPQPPRVVENAGLGLFEIDLQHQSIQASDRMAEILLAPPAPVPRGLDGWLAELPVSTASRLREWLASLATSADTRFLHELNLSDADGHPCWVLLCGQVSGSEGGMGLRVRGVCIDISRRKQAELDLQGAKAALGEQLEDLRRLHELSSRLLEPDTVEEQLRQILGTALEIHRAAHGLISVLDEGRLRIAAQAGFADWPTEQLERFVGDGGVCRLAIWERARVVIPDLQRDPRCRSISALAAAKRLQSAHALPLISDRGELIGAMSVLLDEARQPTAREKAAMDMCASKAVLFIERARTRAALEESELRFESMLDASAVPFCVLSPLRNALGQLEDFRVEYLNAAASRLLKLSREQVLGRSMQAILPGIWQRRPDVLTQGQQALKRNETCEFEVAVPDSEGGRSPEQAFHCIVSPIGHSLAVWAANISDRKRQEQLLHDADRRKDEFIATLAHELRNLLAPIRQAALLSSATGASEEQKRWGNELIDRQVRHMALLLDDLLDISRIARGALLLRLDRAELGSVINNAVEAVRPLIDAKKHRLVLDLPLRPLRFDADALRLSQVVANLLNNAAKYTEPGGEIRLRAQANRGEVCIEVSDNGIGMPPESLSDVFHMYTRLGSGDEGKPGGGLGIGLALTRGLVHLHGGTITAHSDGPGHGSCFSVRIPLLHVSQPVPREPVQAAPAPPPERPRHVLIADDNQEAAQSLSALLQMQGHRVTCAYDGERAVAAFCADPADVCLLDIGMPLQDGKEVARAIRALPGGHRPVLIAITGWGQEADRREAIAAGFDHHLTKPVDPEHVLRLIAAATPHRAQATPMP